MPDHRCNLRNQVDYPLEELLFLTISAVVSGMDTWKSISMFGNEKLPWLRQYFAYENGIPWPSTLARFFAKLDSQTFGKHFIEWVNGLSKLTKGEVVAIDGKTMRGSSSSKGAKDAIHMVSAFASVQGVCLGQLASSDKSNEITAIPKLLDMLTLKGCTVTIDAMGCQTKIARRIIKAGADYVLQVKSNQKGLLEQIEKVFKITQINDSHTAHDLDHGRCEQRTCHVISDLQHLDGYKDWPGLKTLIRVEAQREYKSTAKKQDSIRYYISNKEAGASTFQSDIRRHWAIENNLHWCLDVQFNEDKSRKRQGNSGVNFGILNRVGINMIKKYPEKLSKDNKRKKAAMNDSVREQILQI